MSSIKPQYLRLLATTTLFALAMGLRLGMVNNTTITTPLRVDAFDYYSYALNLKYHGTYSLSRFSGKAPEPDAVRAPGYPVFLVPLVDYPPTGFMLWRISLLQALLDSFSVILALAIFRMIMPEGWALSAALLTAISPHLISASIYLLSETLFTFLMLLSLWLTVKMIQYHRKALAFAAGMLIAAAALTRPTLQFFIIPLAGVLLSGRDRGRHTVLVLALIAGFVLTFSPWLARNLTAIGSITDSTLTINSIHHGMYPDFRYKDIPESTGRPYRFDPRSKTISDSTESLLNEIRRRFDEEPGRHLQWYLLGKPASLFDWDVLTGIGDINIYPVTASPYFSNPVYTLTHKFMKLVHWPLVILAIIAAVLAWFPGFGKQLPKTAHFTVRLLSLLLLYFIALHIVAAPYPRYSIPLRPVIYGLAMLLCSQFYVWLRGGAISRHRLQSPTQTG
jgi:4-amino-4-deoxy-L-arabinose transferase-like glycosyltransferase